MRQLKVQYGETELVFKTGEVARQAGGSVWVKMGETVVLVTATAKQAGPDRYNFLPLTVDYRERAYASGNIPGGYFKREGRPSEREILVSRLIDRSIRPLFPKDFRDDIQVVAMVLSMDPSIGAVVPSLLGASLAIHLAGLPAQDMVAAAHIGHADGNFLLNPTFEQQEDSDLDLVVTGTSSGILMVESSAGELSEDQVLAGIMFGHESMQPVIQSMSDFIKQDVESGDTTPWLWEPSAEVDTSLSEAVIANVKDKVVAAYKLSDKKERQAALKVVKQECGEHFCADIDEADQAAHSKLVGEIISKLEKEHVRGLILGGKPRIDGRDLTTVRPISIQVGGDLLPRTHGACLFQRGETQAVVTATLGGERLAQIVDAIDGSDEKQYFMLHYNFPPYCVGEVGFMAGPKRREIGHGNLAKRAIMHVLPAFDDFPYALRSVSEVTESNGSSSMATVCGTSLALMDAGIPLKSAVAGVAMGLIKEGDSSAILTDILGDEDHLGDMDFKVAGTDKGITALQMDIKTDGITRKIMEDALAQAKDGRLHILGEMAKVLDKPRDGLSKYAPRMHTMKINQDRIRDVIGKGGVTIREIIDLYKVDIDISDDGLVRIQSSDQASLTKAQAHIEQLTADLEVGKIYEGKVAKIMDFGAFITLIPGRDGFLHISQISHEHVNDINDWLTEGQEVAVKLIEIDKQGRAKVSMRALQSQIAD